MKKFRLSIINTLRKYIQDINYNITINQVKKKQDQNVLTSLQGSELKEFILNISDDLIRSGLYNRLFYVGRVKHNFNEYFGWGNTVKFRCIDLDYLARIYYVTFKGKCYVKAGCSGWMTLEEIKKFNSPEARFERSYGYSAKETESVIEVGIIQRSLEYKKVLALIENSMK
tara:strand:+ start:224 stop:736 length:513 start_codon:yes stop_codon:yes gene_type:complete